MEPDQRRKRVAVALDEATARYSWCLPDTLLANHMKVPVVVHRRLLSVNADFIQQKQRSRPFSAGESGKTRLAISKLEAGPFADRRLKKVAG